MNDLNGLQFIVSQTFNIIKRKTSCPLQGSFKLNYTFLSAHDTTNFFENWNRSTVKGTSFFAKLRKFWVMKKRPFLDTVFSKFDTEMYSIF